MPVRPDRRRRRTARPAFAWLAPPLGEGTMAQRGIGPKAALLDRAAAAGLPVPRGVVVPDGGTPPSPAALSLRSPLAVRSAFSAEDGRHRSMAGAFHSELHVAAPDVAAAVTRVRASADGFPEPLRRDVLVMEQVDARHAGVAATERDHGTDVVNVVAGLADRLLGGVEAGERVTLRRLRGRTDRADAAEPWQRRLQVLLRDVRRVFGTADDWDVEWADDGTTCWLVQVRPLTRPVRRAEVLTIANHAEILPPLPSPFMTSLIGRCAPDLFAWYRGIDPALPEGRPFIHVVGGRPFINLSLLEEMLASWGLPTRLVADGFGGRPAHDEPLRPLRVARRTPTLARMAAAQAGAVRGARRRAARAAAVGVEGAPTFAAAVQQAAEAYTLLVTGMFPLSSALGPPVTLLRRAGTLTHHAGGHRTVTTALADDLAAVRAGTLAPGEFLERFGHRGVYESDIARPRFVDDPPAVTPGATPHRTRGSRPRSTGALRRGWRVTATAPLWWLTRPALDAREHLRHEAMRGFLTVRRSLLRLAAAAVADGRLPTAAHLWDLTVDEAIRLDDGWRPDPAFWDARRAELTALAALRPPTLVHSTDDPADWTDGAGDDVHGDRVRGLGLTTGTVRGRAWVLQEPAHHLPDGFSPGGTVLVARSVDAGWIPTFGLVAAVAVETGGDLSHGSIVLRELGLPAATNLPGVTRLVATGDEVELRADSGTLERLAPA